MSRGLHGTIRGPRDRGMATDWSGPVALVPALEWGNL